MRAIVVGAGLAGLTCARSLLESGVDVTVFEADSVPGGKVRTDTIDGFRIDRGFQVLFTAYPAARRQLDYARLALRTFDPGARIAQGDRQQVIADPARDPNALWDSIAADIVPNADKLRIWRLSAELSARPFSALLSGPDQTTERYLRRRGFSERFLENFARPFFGGIFLDRSLGASALLFQYYWKLLAEGEIAVPAQGMGAISQQLAQPLVDRGALRTGVRVEALYRDASSVAGVVLVGGERIAADAVVVACPSPETQRLTGAAMPTEALASTTVYLATERPVLPGRKLLLNANADPLVNHAAPISGIAPDAAPEGRHLTAACLLGCPDESDAALAPRVIADLRRMLTGDRAAQGALATACPVAIVRIPFAQLRQAPGWLQRRPELSPEPGLFLAGEALVGCSIDGALRSGERAAAHLLSR